MAQSKSLSSDPEELLQFMDNLDSDSVIVTSRGILKMSGLIALSPGRFFANITAGEKYGLVLIVYGRAGCDRKFNSKTYRKTIVKFNENTDDTESNICVLSDTRGKITRTTLLSTRGALVLPSLTSNTKGSSW